MTQVSPSINSGDIEEGYVEIKIRCPKLRCPTSFPSRPKLPEIPRVDGYCCARARFYLNASSYLIGALPMIAILASSFALAGWVIGMQVGEDRAPCNQKQNDRQVEVCASTGEYATEGAIVGAMVGTSLSFFTALCHIARTPLEDADQLSCDSGLSGQFFSKNCGIAA